MALLPPIIDINFSLEDEEAHELRRRINQILREPPVAFFFVQVRIRPSPNTTGSVIGNVYQVTLCGIGGIPLADQRRFLLFRKKANDSLLLQYITPHKSPIT